MRKLKEKSAGPLLPGCYHPDLINPPLFHRDDTHSYIFSFLPVMSHVDHGKPQLFLETDHLFAKPEGIREIYLNMEKETVAEILKKGIDDGEISVPESELAALTIVIAVKGMEAQWIMKNNDYPKAEAVDKLLDILFYGISKR